MPASASQSFVIGCALRAGVLGKIDPVEPFVPEAANDPLTVVPTAIAHNPGFKTLEGLVTQTGESAL
jgi:hypothetical protein